MAEATDKETLKTCFNIISSDTKDRPEVVVAFCRGGDKLNPENLTVDQQKLVLGAAKIAFDARSADFITPTDQNPTEPEFIHLAY